jgi:2-polyprenyl-3-methyl-5-hydroxy-6-metoxy-1,4-benzoquinol methylase
VGWGSSSHTNQQKPFPLNYKEKLYQNYRSTHNELLQGGAQSLEKIASRFAVNDYYYGHLLPEDKSAQILDVGCGDGNFVYYLQQSGYAHAGGIDLSAEQIELGQKLGIGGLELASLASYLPGRGEAYDCIIAKDVVEHLTRQEAFEALQLIAAALKPGGSFIMQVPNGQGLFYTSIFYGDYTHEMAYTFQTVRQLFLNTGFSRAECFPVNPYPGTWKGKIRAALWKIKVAQTRFWKMVESGSPAGIFTANLIA